MIKIKTRVSASTRKPISTDKLPIENHDHNNWLYAPPAGGVCRKEKPSIMVKMAARHTVPAPIMAAACLGILLPNRDRRRLGIVDKLTS